MYYKIVTRSFHQDCDDYRKVIATLKGQDSSANIPVDAEIETLKSEEADLLKQLDEVIS